MEIIEQRLGMTPGSADRAPWLFVHGAYRNASAWQFAQAACDERGIASRAISLPGHGTSTMHKGELRHYSIRDYVRIVLAELEHAEPKPILVGHGLGAWLALRAAEECELPGVVLLACPPIGGMLALSLSVFARNPFWGIANLTSGFEQPWSGKESLAQSLLGSSAPSGPESRCVLRELLRFPTVYPEKVTAPVLVLSGERDRLMTPACHRELTTRLSNATQSTLPGAPHDAWAEGWAESLVDAIVNWI